jgi:predicted N-acyltransferase
VHHLTVEFIDCREKLDHSELDALVSTVNIQHKTKYLQLLTKNLDNDFKGYFIVAKHQSEIVAWTYAFIDNNLSFHGLLSGMMERLYNIFPIRFRAAFVSSPVAEYNVFHIKDGYKSHEDEIIGKMLADAIEYFKKEKVKMVVVKDHITKYPSEFLHKKFTHLHFMPGTYLDFECIQHGCTCFDDYLMSLKKKWRSNIRNKMNRRKEDLQIEVITAASLTEDECVRCHELYFQTRGKQRLKHECLSSDYFCACGNEFGDSCKMMVARVDGVIIGFAQLLENEGDVINVRMGMDYAYNKEYSLYYHLLYENIVYCIKNGKKKLYTSQTSYRPKLEVGAKLMPLHTYVYFQNPVLHKVFGRIFADSCKCYTELLETEKPGEVLAKYNLCPY